MDETVHLINVGLTYWTCSCGRSGVFITQGDKEKFSGVCPGSALS